jgi:hypothetical protein
MSPESCPIPRLIWEERSIIAGSRPGEGVFRTRCFHAAFSKAGIRIYGAAWRHLDTMPFWWDERGWLAVDTGRIQKRPEP